LPPLNYKRGLRRVYLTLATVWACAVLAVSIKDRPRPVDFAAEARKYGLTYSSQPPKTPVPAVPPPPPGFVEEQQPPAPANATDELNKILDFVQQESPVQYWSERLALMLIPPSGGYFILFLVLPWIWRGFSLN
jgi:hypothetical protein